MDLLNKEHITIADIQSLKDNGIGESLNLEYKGAGALKKDDPTKIKITKSISAFANSNGGVLIYGIHEEDQQPKYISYIDGNVFTNEWLEQIIGNIHRKVKVEIIPVRLNDDLSKTIYVVRIPESTDAPHMATDGKYYRRMNFQVVAMEEYEVRNLYYRKDFGELSIDENFLMRYDGLDSKDDSRHNFEIIFSVTNTSSVVEKEYKMTLNFIQAEGMSLNWERDQGYIGTPNPNKVSVSTSRMIPIFPNENLAIMRITVGLASASIESNLANAKLIEFLHHSSGTQEIEYAFEDLFKNYLVKHGIITEDSKLKSTEKPNKYNFG